jgi:hypothetical protein
LLYQPRRAADRGYAAVGKGDEDEGVGHGDFSNVNVLRLCVRREFLGTKLSTQH